MTPTVGVDRSTDPWVQERSPVDRREPALAAPGPGPGRSTFGHGRPTTAERNVQAVPDSVPFAEWKRLRRCAHMAGSRWAEVRLRPDTKFARSDGAMAGHGRYRCASAHDVSGSLRRKAVCTRAGGLRSHPEGGLLLGSRELEFLSHRYTYTGTQRHNLGVDCQRLPDSRLRNLQFEPTN
jgi:hypothetical protein